MLFKNLSKYAYTRYAIIKPPATMNRTVAITEAVWITISLVTCARTNSIVSDTFLSTLNKNPCACSSVNS